MTQSDVIDVKSIRTALDLTQTQLAEELGVDQTTVSNWEKNGGPSRGPARKLLEQIASERRI